jgi:hypothetical protein
VTWWARLVQWLHPMPTPKWDKWSQPHAGGQFRWSSSLLNRHHPDKPRVFVVVEGDRIGVTWAGRAETLWVTEVQLRGLAQFHTAWGAILWLFEPTTTRPHYPEPDELLRAMRST